MNTKSQLADQFEELTLYAIRESRAVASGDDEPFEFRRQGQRLPAEIGKRLRGQNVLAPKIVLFVLGVFVLLV